MHPRAIAEKHPDQPAVIMGDGGGTITFAELDRRSNQVAHLFRECGLGHGDSVAIFAENHPDFLVVTWAAQRSGLYYTAINSHLTAPEASYIVENCGASLLISTDFLEPIACDIVSSSLRYRYSLDRLATTVANLPTTPVSDEAEGDFMLYSSGTTGRPKGTRRPLSLARLGESEAVGLPFLRALGIGDGHIYLNPAPLYHAAPLSFCMGSHRLGATVVVMERFDAHRCLELISLHRVTHAQFVPTMFVRMLKLPEATRDAIDVSSLQRVVHAAAPCPVEVKRGMIEWWGPIVDEYYSATEGMGATFIRGEEWLEHPGSVGRAIVGEIHITDDDGRDLPRGEIGTIWFSKGYDFTYHGDPARTEEARDHRGRSTVGDVGYVDEDGYLYLTDRKAFMIISGGVNIYPQEIEDTLIAHPSVFDVAVIGVPNPDLGEEVKAVVQPAPGVAPSATLEAELHSWCEQHLASFKHPRSIDFVAALPRLDTGKLYKADLRASYWQGSGEVSEDVGT